MRIVIIPKVGEKKLFAQWRFINLHCDYHFVHRIICSCGIFDWVFQARSVQKKGKHVEFCDINYKCIFECEFERNSKRHCADSETACAQYLIYIFNYNCNNWWTFIIAIKWMLMWLMSSDPRLGFAVRFLLLYKECVIYKTNIPLCKIRYFQ